MAATQIIWIGIRLLLLLTVAKAENTITSIDVGVIIDDDWYGRTARSALELAAQDVNNHGLLGSSTRLALHFNHSAGDTVRAGIAALGLIQKEHVVAIIGPQTSQEACFVAELCNASQVAMITYSATDPLLSARRYPLFFRVAHSDAVQAKVLAELVSYFGWRKVVVIHSDNDYGNGMLSNLNEALHAVGSDIEYRLAIPVTAGDDFIRGELYKLYAMQTRVFIVHMISTLGLRLLAQSKAVGMMVADFAWIVTDGFALELDRLELKNMQGVLATRSFVSPDPQFFRRWTARFQAENPKDKAELNVFACYAYDAVSMLARALSRMSDRKFRFSRDGDVPVLQNGNELRRRLAETNFRGVSGWVRIDDGELADSEYEILNVVGTGYQRVGFWKSQGGLRKDSGSNDGGLDAILWPGRSHLTPRGWVPPTLGKKMRIAVPVKFGFREFITAENASSSGTDNFLITGGFVIDVFNAVLQRLPYSLPYEFVAQGNGIHMPSYDEVVQMVHHKNVEAAVGDFTILAYRSNYVDFTQPYFESGLIMVVPVKQDDSGMAWAFMRPFTPGMWGATAGVFLFTGFVVWLLEHRRNTVFRGKPRKQVVTLLWFSFSTLVFAHREKVVSSLAKAVLLIWLFVVLILNSSYTASLTSILTVQQIKPMVPDVQSLILNKNNVGYQNGSFVADFLVEQLKIPMERLKAYESPEQYAKALRSGEVAAIFDEIPFIRVFLSKYCGFTTVDPTYRTGGLGFAFERGSPLVSDMSKAVLELSESPEMERIQRKWLNSTACTGGGSKMDSKRLSMSSFWGLYLITGTASGMALLVFFGKLIYKYLNDDTVEKPQGPLSTRIKSFVTYMDQSMIKQQRSLPNRKKRRVTPPSPRELTALTATGDFGEMPMTPMTLGFGTESHASMSSPPPLSFVSVDLDESDLEFEPDTRPPR